ncbi:MAG: hypothetical protein ABIY50_08935 [Ignavibacteria bacterium]
MLTQTTKKNNTNSIFILDKEQLTHKLPPTPSPKEIKALGNAYGFDISAMNRPGFVLDAHDPITPKKAQLMVKLNNYVYVNDYAKPYYYKFSQWFYDGAWSDNIPGKVTIKFDENFDIQNGIIFLKVGSHQNAAWSGGGFTIKIGNRNLFVRSNHDNSNGYDDRFVSQTIPVVIYTPPGSRRVSPLSNIEITCNHGMWKFFSASYNPYLIKVR